MAPRNGSRDLRDSAPAPRPWWSGLLQRPRRNIRIALTKKTTQPDLSRDRTSRRAVSQTMHAVARAVAGARWIKHRFTGVRRHPGRAIRRSVHVLHAQRWPLAGLLLMTAAGVGLAGQVTVFHAMLVAGGILFLTAPGGVRNAARGPSARVSVRGMGGRPRPDGHARHNPGDVAGLRRELEQGLETLKDMQWEARDNESRYRDLLDNQKDIILRRDAEGRLIFVNYAFCEAFGMESQEVLGRPFSPQVLESDAGSLNSLTPETQEAHEALPAANEPEMAGTLDVRSGAGAGDDSEVAAVRFTQRIQTAGEPRWYAWEEKTIRNPDTGDVETQCVGRDVTAQRLAESRLLIARQDAEAASETKSRFLAIMSHEIRTPMSGILGMTELLQSTELSPEQETYAVAVKDSAQNLLTIIDEILDFSKIEAGRLDLTCSAFPVGAMVQSVVELLAPKAHDRNLELAWHIATDAPEFVVGDELRVRQILMNLVGNAVKFTETGGVSVVVRAAPDAADDTKCGTGTPTDAPAPAGQLHFIVRDTGIGLDASKRSAIFGEFEQGDTTTTRRFGGTGLGLAISRRLARSMGGDIYLDSQPGEGSTFSLALPLPPASARLADRLSALPEAPAAAYRAIIASDRRIEADAIAETLRGAGHSAIVVSPREATGHIRAAKADRTPFDTLFLESTTPARLRASILDAAGMANAAPDDVRDGAPGNHKLTAFILLDPTDRDRLSEFRKEGAAAYLVRPVRPSSLLYRLNAAHRTVDEADSGSGRDANRNGHKVRGEQNTPQVTEQGNRGNAAATPVQRRVLLAEDNAVNALLATRMLERLDAEVIHVANGREALGAVQRGLDGDGAPVDLVLMDLHMPEMDGLTATRRILELAPGAGAAPDRTRCVPPIVALTANAFSDDRKACLEAGMVDYLSKPFEAAQLAAILERWCECEPGGDIGGAGGMISSGSSEMVRTP